MSKQRIPSAHWWQTAGRLRPLAAEYIAKAKAVELAETGHECGHRFEITIRSAVHSGIAGEGPESHSDAGWWGEPELIAQEAIGLIIATAYLTETASALNEKEMTSAERQALEVSVREASEELASQIDLSPERPTASEFGRVIEQGLEYLRDIYEDGDDA